jgi:hypothetical protein
MNRVAWALAALFVVLVVVLIFVFGDDAGEVTTTIPGTTTTLEEATTTEGETTTTVQVTTTTSAETTTSQGETTTTGLEGNWSDEPLVVFEFGALGWWSGGGWVRVDEGTSLPVSGGEDYQIALLGDGGVTTGGAQISVCEPLANPGVELADSLGGPWPAPNGVAVSAPWPLVPHLVEEISDDGTYAAIAGQLLAERGLNVTSPVIKQAIRLDLEGDGVNEVLVVAEEVPSDLFAQVGNYSIAFLQRVVGGEVQNAILGDQVVLEVPEGTTPFIISYTVGAVADLSGDGKMEIVMNETYYEGDSVVVWEYVNDEVGPVAQISSGCGV